MKRRSRVIEYVNNFDPDEARVPAGGPGGGEWTAGGGGGGAATATPPKPGAASAGRDGTVRGASFHYPDGYHPPQSKSPGVQPGPNADLGGATRPQMTTDEAKKLTAYTDVQVFRTLNEALKNNATLARPGKLAQMFGAKDVAGVHEAMQKVFARAKTLDTPMTLKRGVFSRNPEQLAQSMLASQGKVVKLPGYQSTSAVQEDHDSFGESGGGYKGNVKFTIHAVHGLDMKPYSVFPGENEVLLNHNSEYKVGRVEKHDGTWHIELFQVPPTPGVTKNVYYEQHTDTGHFYQVLVGYVGNAQSADGPAGAGGQRPAGGGPVGRGRGGQGGTGGSRLVPAGGRRLGKAVRRKYDPSRTIALRRGMTQLVRQKFTILKGKVRRLIVEQNAFGLTTNRFDPDKHPRDDAGRWAAVFPKTEDWGLEDPDYGGLVLPWEPLKHPLGLKDGEFLHGTTDKNWASIKRGGLKPRGGLGADRAASMVGRNYSTADGRAASVYITNREDVAGFFARYTTDTYGGHPNVIRVRIPDSELKKLRTDEKAFFDEKDHGAYRYVGTIKPEWIEGRYVKKGDRVVFTKNAEPAGVVLYAVVHFHDEMTNPPTLNYSPDQPRDEYGRWSESGALREAVWKGGGFTYRPVGQGKFGARLDKWMPTKGTVVSLPRERGYEHPVSETEFKQHGKELIKDYLKRVRDDIKAGKLDKKHTAVGAWHDKATGRVVLDVNEVYHNKEEAIRVGRERKQDAVFDLGTFDTIDLRDERGHRPTGNAGRVNGRRDGRRTGGTGSNDDGGTGTLNATYQFHSDPDKLVRFQQWLHQQFDDQLTSPSDERVWAAYVKAGFEKGAGRAWDDTPDGPDDLIAGGAFDAGRKDQFLRTTLRAPESVEKVKLLAGRAFDEMEGVTDDMAVRMSRILADGLVEGAGPDEVADRLDAALDFGQARAERIARTEIIRAHAEGQLDAFDAMGVSELGVDVEWSTAGDGRVCPQCEEMDGKVFDVDEAHGMIPMHPDCRCAFVPAVRMVGKA